jgi:hypothetical protein
MVSKGVRSQRAVRFLVGEAGVGQVMDIGAGIPAGGNVHEIARQAAPDVRVVYVDNDPIVQVHAERPARRGRPHPRRPGRPA